MKALFVAASFAVAALVSHAAYADAPAGSTALCKDGTYYSGKSKRGACSGHDGIQDWYGAKGPTPAATPAATGTTAAAPAAAATDTPAEPKKKRKKKDADTATAPAAPAATPATPAAAAPAPAPAAAPAATTTPEAGTAMKRKAPTPAKDIAQKPGGGPGLVWVNSSSKVYHCPGDEWYGKTKEGSYMTEAAAKAAGAHGSGNKECTAAK